MHIQPDHQHKLSNEILDEEFVRLLTIIEAKYYIFNRHIQIRIEKWVEKLLECDQTIQCRKTRNQYISLLYEMVLNGEIKGIFLKMPPQNRIPRLQQSECRRALSQLKFPPKQPRIQNNQIYFAKLQCPNGDNCSQIITPSCLSQRTQQKIHAQNQNDSINKQNTSNFIGSKIKILNFKKGISSLTHDHLLNKIISLMTKYQNKFKEDPQFISIIENIQEIITYRKNKKQKYSIGEQSEELRVQEGIGINMANLFQFGSPRGKTQMQYIKAALL